MHTKFLSEILVGRIQFGYLDVDDGVILKFILTGIG
jgi:hypothetical protein